MLQVFSDYLNTQTPHFTLVEEKEGEESHTRVTAGPHPAEGKQGSPKSWWSHRSLLLMPLLRQRALISTGE